MSKQDNPVNEQCELCLSRRYPVYAVLHIGDKLKVVDRRCYAKLTGRQE